MGRHLAPADHAGILQRWELFHTIRTLTGLCPFALIIAVAVVARPATLQDALRGVA